MRARLLAGLICPVAISAGAANADDNTTQGSAPQPSPSSTQAAPAAVLSSKAKVFLISPEQSQQDFMCGEGRLESIQATALAEHRIVSIVLLDQSKNPIPDGVWTSAFGFHLTHKQNVIINVVMICGE